MCYIYIYKMCCVQLYPSVVLGYKYEPGLHLVDFALPLFDLTKF